MHVPPVHEHVDTRLAVGVYEILERRRIVLDAIYLLTSHLDRPRIVAFDAQVKVATRCSAVRSRRHDEPHTVLPAEKAEVCGIGTNHDVRNCGRDHKHFACRRRHSHRQRLDLGERERHG